VDDFELDWHMDETSGLSGEPEILLEERTVRREIGSGQLSMQIDVNTTRSASVLATVNQFAVLPNLVYAPGSGKRCHRNTCLSSRLTSTRSPLDDFRYPQKTRKPRAPASARPAFCLHYQLLTVRPSNTGSGSNEKERVVLAFLPGDFPLYLWVEVLPDEDKLVVVVRCQ
jgi:hypothetical protein